MNQSEPFGAWDLASVYRDDSDAVAAARSARESAGRLAVSVERTTRLAVELPAFLGEFAEIEAQLDAALEYARMCQYADALADGVQELVAAVQTDVTAGRDALERVLDVWRAADEADARVALNTTAASVHYRLTRARALTKYRLSPRDEVVWSARTESARDRWTHLQELVEAGVRITFDAGQGAKVWGFGDLTTLLRSPDAMLRRSARDALADGVGEIRDVVALAWDAAVADRLAEDDLRGYEHPAQETLRDEDLPDDGFDALVREVPLRADLFRTFLDAQRQFLGLATMSAVDREASVVTPPLTKSEVASHAVDGLRSLHPSLGEDAAELIALGRVDGQTRPGKQRYACTYATHLEPPSFIGFRFTGQLANVTLLGHELGHAVAITRAAAAQPPLARGWPGVLFEVPSLIGEIASGDTLVAARPDLAREMTLTAMQDILWSVFQTLTFCQVELDLYETRASGSPLTADVIEAAFLERFGTLFGPAIEFDEQDARVELGTWANYAVADRFYNFQYTVGALTALALQARRRTDPERFGVEYVAFLGLGRSASPADQLATLGLELGAATWSAGLAELEVRIDRAREFLLAT